MKSIQHNKHKKPLNLSVGAENKPTEIQTIELVFLHGWGMNKGIWSNFIEQCREQSLEQCREKYSDDYLRLQLDLVFTAIDLPGFGERSSDNIQDYSLHDFAESVYAQLSQATILIGWSFGGLVAQCLADGHFPKVIGHVQVASTPKFVESVDWPGISHSVLNDFHTQLNKNQHALIKRFIAIQCMGLANAKETIKVITELLYQYPPSSHDSLAKTLDLLIESDLRGLLKTSTLPCLRIFGRLDSLVPARAIELISESCEKTELVVIKKAAHAPFISHPQETAGLILDFITKNVVASLK